MESGFACEDARERRRRELQKWLKIEQRVPPEKTDTSFGEATGIFLPIRLFERQQRALQQNGSFTPNAKSICA
jgi:hypothetical protein